MDTGKEDEREKLRRDRQKGEKRCREGEGRQKQGSGMEWTLARKGRDDEIWKTTMLETREKGEKKKGKSG